MAYFSWKFIWRMRDFFSTKKCSWISKVDKLFENIKVIMFVWKVLYTIGNRNWILNNFILDVWLHIKLNKNLRIQTFLEDCWCWNVWFKVFTFEIIWIKCLKYQTLQNKIVSEKSQNCFMYFRHAFEDFSVKNNNVPL